MKSNCFIWFAVVLGAMVFVGCVNRPAPSPNEMILGKWENKEYHVFDEEDIAEGSIFTEAMVTGVIKYEFLANHTEKRRGTVICEYHVVKEDYDKWLSLTIVFEYEGTWKIEEDKLIQKGKKSNYRFSHHGMEDYDPERDDHYIEMFKSNFESIYQEAEEDDLKEHSFRISSLSETELLLQKKNGDIMMLDRITDKSR